MMRKLWSKVRSGWSDLIRKRTQRRFVVWLASFALSLLLFAPSISRVLYAWAADGAAVASGHADHADHAGLEHAGMPDHAGMAEHLGMPMNGDVCGYCTLMCHNPVLSSALAFVILPLPRTPYSTAFAETRAPVPVLLDRRSRGPPVA